MMSDDDKRLDSNSTSDEKLADVIDLNEAREKKEAEGTSEDAPAAQTISVGDAIAGIKDLISSLRAQMEPVRHTIHDIIDASKAGAATAREKMGLDDAQANETAKDEADKDTENASDENEKAKSIIDDGIDRATEALTPDQETVKQTSEVINLAYERLKRQGIEKKIDLKNIIEEQFAAYADKNLTDKDYTVDENGKRVVKLDAKFMQEHGLEAVPTVLGGIAHSVVGTLFGDILGINEQEKTADAENQAASEASDAEADASKDEPKYRVQFDFAKLLGEALKNAKISSVKSAETGETVEVDEKESALAREVASKGAQMMEDVLNGKEPDEALSKIEGTVANPNHIPPSLAPEEITPVDEKHQRILDLAKEYDQALKGNDDDQ